MAQLTPRLPLLRRQLVRVRVRVRVRARVMLTLALALALALTFISASRFFLSASHVLSSA